MLEIKKEKVTKEIEEEFYKCDICGKDLSLNRNDTNYLIQLRLVTDRGYDFEEGLVYDICPKCMKDKIFDYIKDLSGENPREYETDW
jgi:hypothetical protein